MLPSTTEDSVKSDWEAVICGDLRAYERVVERFKGAVSAVAYARIGDFAVSEDIAQETFLVAWQSRRQLRDPSRLLGWLCGIARNLALQALRDRKRRMAASLDAADTRVADPSDGPAEKIVSEEEQSLVWMALEQLDETYRDVLVLYYRQSHSVTEVAHALDLSEPTVRQRLSRGRNLLRNEVTRRIEDTLRQSGPGSRFTAAVMAALGSADTTSAIQVTSGIGAAAKVASTLATWGTKSMVASSVMGFLGGMIGVVGGLTGAWLSTYVPAQLAPSMTERRFMESEGLVVRRASILFAIGVCIAALIPILGAPIWVGLAINGVLMVIFMIYVIRGARRVHRAVQHIRATVDPLTDPNPAWLKSYLQSSGKLSERRWQGRRGTSPTRLLGLPLWDFQVSDPVLNGLAGDQKPLHACGWLAVGDTATGVVALGGRARGLIAIGGIASGIVAAGGLSFGLIGFGGLALGGLALGGLAIGHSAIGGLALGWNAAGGGCVAIYSAVGGFAAAGTTAIGGFAVAFEHAVGGFAAARESNTEAAQVAAQSAWMATYFKPDAIDMHDPGTLGRFLLTLLGIMIATLVVLGCAPLLMFKRTSAVKDERVT